MFKCSWFKMLVAVPGGDAKGVARLPVEFLVVDHGPPAALDDMVNRRGRLPHLGALGAGVEAGG